MVRAIIKRVHTRALGSELLANPFVDFADQLLREIALPHTRLVGYHDHGQARLVQLSHRRSGPWEQAQTVNVVDVTNLFRHRAIAVEEDGPTLRGAGGSSVLHGRSEFGV